MKYKIDITILKQVYERKGKKEEKYIIYLK